MKKIKYIIILILIITNSSCVERSEKYETLKKYADSLEKYIKLQNDEIDETFAVMNSIEEGLKSIRKGENIIVMSSNENSNKASRENLKNDMLIIKDVINSYQDQIAKLKENSKLNSIQFNKRLKKMEDELMEKSQILTQLTNQLELKEGQLTIKNEQIWSLDRLIKTMQADMSKMHAENNDMKTRLSEQDEELHSAYYIVGTKQNLIDAGVMTKGGLFKSAKVSYLTEKDSFIKIDYRKITEINTNSPKAKILSIHPKGTYALEKSGDEMVLTISNPNEFWEQIKYLVIQTN